MTANETEPTTDTTTSSYKSSEDDTYVDSSDESVSTNKADSTDDVEIDRLVGQVSLDDLRWVYRNTFASVIVDKPVEDAFKHGFEIRGDPTTKVGELLETTNWVDEYKRARKKARRDGFALLHVIFEDDAEGPWVPVSDSNVTGVTRVKPVTVDNLADSASDGRIIDQIPDDLDEYEDFDDHNDIEVRESGIVVDRRPFSPNYGDPIGYVLDRVDDTRRDGTFIHESRVQHFVYNDTVDVTYKGKNDNGEEYLGRWEGDSILQPAYHYIKASFKGTWAIAQTLFRYSSPLYEIRLPDRINDPDTVDDIRKEWRGLNSMAEAVIPPDFELDLHSTEGNLEPEEYFDVIFDEICASTEMTKSVLFGTQTGTTTGSETDIKNYFNQVERFRRNTVEDDINEFVRMVMRANKSVVPTFAMAYRIQWPELFRLNPLDEAERWNRVMNTLNQAANQFFITPNEGREILSEMLNEEYDIELEGDLDESDFEMLENLQMAQVGAETTGEKSEGNPRVGNNGGGMEQGQTTGEIGNSGDGVSFEY